MSDSNFWKKLSEKFRELPKGTLILQAEKYYVVGQTEEPKWRLIGEIGRKAEFETLAKRGAIRVSLRPTPDLLDLWIETIFRQVPYDQDQTFFGTTNSPGTGGNTVFRHIHDLSRRSADCCKIMESAAIQREFDGSLIEKQPRLPVAPDPPPPPTLGEQIQNLRLECNWTIEVLARKTGFDEKTVKRHLSGSAMPRLGNLAIYQQAFSKALNRQILIEKTPPKRPLNVR